VCIRRRRFKFKRVSVKFCHIYCVVYHAFVVLSVITTIVIIILLIYYFRSDRNVLKPRNNEMQSYTADFDPAAATWRTRRNICVVFDFGLLSPLCENYVTSSEKLEVHNILYCRHRRTQPRTGNIYKNLVTTPAHISSVFSALSFSRLADIQWPIAMTNCSSAFTDYNTLLRSKCTYSWLSSSAKFADDAFNACSLTPS